MFGGFPDGPMYFGPFDQLPIKETFTLSRLSSDPLIPSKQFNFQWAKRTPPHGKTDGKTDRNTFLEPAFLSALTRNKNGFLESP